MGNVVVESPHVTAYLTASMGSLRLPGSGGWCRLLELSLVVLMVTS